MSEPLWTAAALAEAIGGRPAGSDGPPTTGVSIDAGMLAPGDAYFAIGEDESDGHRSVGSALAKGASLAVIAQERLPALGRVTGALIVVDDVFEALGHLAVAGRARFRGKTIAIAGPGDASPISQMLRDALSRRGRVHGAEASAGDILGVLVGLARMTADAPFALFELGLDGPGDNGALASVVRPDLVIAGGSFDPGTPDGADNVFSAIGQATTVVLDRDDEMFEAFFGEATRAGIERLISFGRHPDSDARLDEFTDAPPGVLVRADIGGRAMSYALPGPELAMDSLAVLAAVQAVGADLDAAGAALASFAIEDTVADEPDSDKSEANSLC